MLWDVPGVAAGDAANLVRWSEWQQGASKLGALELGLAVNARCLLLHAEGREWFVGSPLFLRAAIPELTVHCFFSPCPPTPFLHLKVMCPGLCTCIKDLK